MPDQVDTSLPVALHPDAVGRLALPDRDVSYLRSAVELMGESLKKARDRAASVAAGTLDPATRAKALERIVGEAANAHAESEERVTRFLDGLEADWTGELERALWGAATPMPAAVVAELRGMLRAMPSAAERAKFIGDAIASRDARVLRAIFDSHVPACLLGLSDEQYSELRSRALGTVDPTRGNRREAFRLARSRYQAACAVWYEELNKLAPK